MAGHSFDERAAHWDDPEKIERARVVAAQIGRAVDLHTGLRVLEYGAGTALLSQALAPRVGPLTVTDPSTGMRAVLADKVASGALPPGTVVQDLDLSTGRVPAETYDLVISLLALHHIPDVRTVLRGFAALLEPGGRVALADLVSEDGSFHDSPDFDGHMGFDTDELSGWLREAGFAGIDVRHADDLVKNGRSFGIFLVTATRG